jgi:hypothetical protein
MMMASMRAFCERGSTDTHQQLWSYAYQPPPKSNSVDNEWFQQHALQNKSWWWACIFHKQRRRLHVAW